MFQKQTGKKSRLKDRTAAMKKAGYAYSLIQLERQLQSMSCHDIIEVNEC